MKLKNLLGTLALLPVLAGLTACAAETGEELGFEDGVALDEADLDTIEQAYGEAACRTVAVSAPASGNIHSVQPRCIWSDDVPPSTSYGYSTCTRSYITEVQSTGSESGAHIGVEYGGVAPTTQTGCERTHVKATIYGEGNYSPIHNVVLEASGTWTCLPNFGGGCYMGCKVPSVSTYYSFGGPVLRKSEYRVVAQAYNLVPAGGGMFLSLPQKVRTRIAPPCVN